MPIATTKRVWNGSKPALQDIVWWEDQYSERLIAHNTYRTTIRIAESLNSEYSFRTVPAVRFHGTIIVVSFGSGRFRISSGGHRTVTTKQRLNALLPLGVRVWQKDFAWFVSDAQGERAFVDGMEVYSYV